MDAGPLYGPGMCLAGCAQTGDYHFLFFFCCWCASLTQPPTSIWLREWNIFTNVLTSAAMSLWFYIIICAVNIFPPMMFLFIMSVRFSICMWGTGCAKNLFEFVCRGSSHAGMCDVIFQYGKIKLKSSMIVF